MHKVTLDFATKHAHRFTGRVLDVGSYNFNGQLRDVLPITVGVDMAPGPGVDIVCNASNLIQRFGPESFDAVCSSDALEHARKWRAMLNNMWGVLKPGGLLLLTMANESKGRHNYPDDYWRIPLHQFYGMFARNPILDSFVGGPSQGVLVEKRYPLDLNFKPKRVL